MPFIAKSAAPVASAPAARHWTFDRAALGGLTAFVAPPGYLMSEGLFEALQRQGTAGDLGPARPRGPRPRHLPALPGRRRPAAPSRLRPPGGGFEELAAALAAAAPAPASLVVEHAHHLGGTAALLGVLLAPLLDEDRACVVTSDAPLPAGALPARGATVTADDLRLGPGAAGELLGREAPRLPAAAARRAATLCRGAAADLVAVCGAAATLGPGRVERAVDQASGIEELLAHLASGWLEGPGPTATGPSPSPWRSATATRRCRRRCWGRRDRRRPGRGSSRSPTAGRRSGPAGAARSGPPWARPGPWAPRRSTGRPTTCSTGAPPNGPCPSTWSWRTGPAPPGPRPPRRAGRPPALAPRPGPEGHLLTVHLLGQLKVRLDDVPVDDWPSGRGRSLFKYLVTHRDPWPRRELLMDAFWPEAAPAAARNSLNVAVHGLRRAFRASAGVEVVVLEDGAYRLGPGLRLWLDVDEFELHVAAGRRLEAAGDLAGAAAAYERALALYQGDLLADDPYEDWPVPAREHLLLTYLDVLDRLSGLLLRPAPVRRLRGPVPAAGGQGPLPRGRPPAADALLQPPGPAPPGPAPVPGLRRRPPPGPGGRPRAGHRRPGPPAPRPPAHLTPPSPT